MNKAANRLLRIRHKLIRLYLKLVRDPDYKSKADYWPWVRIERFEPSKYDITYRGKAVCTSSAFTDFNRMTGDMAIIGSGPSVNLMDFGRISKLKCVLLNGAISLIDLHGLEPLASIVVDSTFVENRFDMLRCLPPGSNLIFAPGVIRAVAERDAEFLSKMNVFLTQNILRPVYDPGPRFEEEREIAQESRFSFDLDCGYFDGGTVMAVGIQLAYQMGVRNTYLIGLDISNSKSPRFYETARNKTKCGLADDYESSILPFMRAASEIFCSASLSIHNCSPCSRLPYDVIPYCDDFAQPDVRPTFAPARAPQKSMPNSPGP